MGMAVPVTVPLLSQIMHALEEPQQLQILESNDKMAMNQTIPQTPLPEYLFEEMAKE